MSRNLSEFSRRKELKNNLFDKLGNLAIVNDGFPDPEKLDQLLVEELLFGKANTYGTTTFYDFQKQDNKGQRFMIVRTRSVYVMVPRKTHMRKAGKVEEIKN